MLKKIIFYTFTLMLFFSTAYAEKTVVVSTTQIYDLAYNIAGDNVKVISILSPGQDPHTYQPVPNDIDKVRNSDLVIENGFHLEGKNWMKTLANDAGKPLVTATDGIKPLIMELGGMEVHDPHAWFTPRNAAVYVNNITKALIELAPEYKNNFTARAKLYLANLKALDGWIRSEVAIIPPEKRVLVTNHDAFQYFAAEYGFVNTSPIGWSTGSEIGGGVTPQRREAVVSAIKMMNVRSIFVETTINPKLLREIAKDAGVSIGGSLYSDSMGDKDSPGESYIGMMRENVLTIVGGLR
ncbi:periplasmic solute binding protein [Denitrovibrio acetiphilus DSM 12809]|uniref:Periplasmic solute binding protein n=1 Tax=Denitrovibrio acetiphilus (strain DSM 12809 / NBRC 114555 / N2460) TaxID=522772 RepID=D4H2B3_DENA2|nr:zinc ABC transporter substrate-binding protein [Denitrovibrio acetiphilus]ADD68904.1 periplasmic solute binding protein [Denitrovibrio acetiphilus DSM 12809]